MFDERVQTYLFSHPAVFFVSLIVPLVGARAIVLQRARGWRGAGPLDGSPPDTSALPAPLRRARPAHVGATSVHRAGLIPLWCYRQQHPLNLILLGGWTVTMSIGVGMVCATYPSVIVLEALLLTAGITVRARARARACARVRAPAIAPLPSPRGPP